MLEFNPEGFLSVLNDFPLTLLLIQNHFNRLSILSSQTFVFLPSSYFFVVFCIVFLCLFSFLFAFISPLFFLFFIITAFIFRPIKKSGFPLFLHVLLPCFVVFKLQELSTIIVFFSNNFHSFLFVFLTLSLFSFLFGQRELIDICI